MQEQASYGFNKNDAEELVGKLGDVESVKFFHRQAAARSGEVAFFALTEDLTGTSALGRRADSSGTAIDPTSTAINLYTEWNRPLGAIAGYYGLWYRTGGSWKFLQGPCIDNSCDLEDSDIDLDSPPDGAVNEEYDHEVIGTDLAGAMVATGLPPGLTFNGSTGEISGTPTQEGVYTVVISGTSEENECPITRAFNLTINPCDVEDAFIDLDDPPPATVDEAYEHEILWDDLEDPPTVINLPPGITFDTTTGKIEGTPTEEGAWTVTVRGVTIPNECVIEKYFVFQVGPCDTEGSLLFVAVGTSNFLEVGVPFFMVVNGVDVDYPIDLEKVELCEPSPGVCVSASLPSGLVWDEDTGILSGTPDEPNDCYNPGFYRLTFKAISTANECPVRTTFDLYYLCDCPDSYEIDCADAWVIECGGPIGMPLWEVNTADSWTPAKSNATITSATNLPPGLSLSGGTISGTPTEAGSWLVVICGEIDSGTYEGCQVCNTVTITVLQEV